MCNDFKKNKELQITNRIMNIERLKANMIFDMAKLNKSLLTEDETINFSDILSNIILDSYILGYELGFDMETINSRLNDKIRLKILDEYNPLHNEYVKLAKVLETKK